jgi:hypothetical protein
MTEARTPSDLVECAQATGARLRALATPGSPLEAGAKAIDDLVLLVRALARPQREAEQVEAEAWGLAEHRIDDLLAKRFGDSMRG